MQWSDRATYLMTVIYAAMIIFSIPSLYTALFVKPSKVIYKIKKEAFNKDLGKYVINTTDVESIEIGDKLDFICIMAPYFAYAVIIYYVCEYVYYEPSNEWEIKNERVIVTKDVKCQTHTYLDEPLNNYNDLSNPYLLRDI